MLKKESLIKKKPLQDNKEILSYIFNSEDPSPRIRLSLLQVQNFFIKNKSLSLIKFFDIRDNNLYLYVSFSNFFNDLGIIIRVLFNNMLKNPNNNLDKVILISKYSNNDRVVIMTVKSIIDYMSNKIDYVTFTNLVKWA